MNNEKLDKIIPTDELDNTLPKYEPVKLSGKNLAQQYVSAFNTGMNIYQCVNYLQGYIEWIINSTNNVVKSWNDSVDETLNKSIEITKETTTNQFNNVWENKQPELIEQVNTLTTTQFNKDFTVVEGRINTTLENQNANIKNIQNEQKELETNTNNTINTQNTKINLIQTQQTNLSSEQTILSNRMNTFTKLSEGSTTGDAELQDIRVGANGVTYSTAGDAVRGQYNELKEILGKYFEFYDYRDGSKSFDFNTIYHDNRITFINSNTNILNAPLDKIKDGSTWIVLNFYDKDLPRFITQDLINSDINTHATRLYFNDKWIDWYFSTIGQNVNDLRGTNKSFDFNTVKKEISQTFLNVSNTISNAPYALTSGTWLVTNYYDYNNPYFITQTVKNIEIPNEDKQAYRVYLLEHSRWTEWEISESTNVQNKIFRCGPGQEYTTLRLAVSSAIQVKNATVVVYPDTYDLSVEFKDVLDSKNGTGIKLDNGVHIIFMAGSYVKANLELDSWSLTNFEPFKAVGDFTLEGLNIECTNTRYCVHDEHSDTEQTYINKYINCNMIYHPKGQKTYVQCIGGGLGRNGYIDIVGGKYTTVIDDVNNDIPISYHNNGTYNNAYSVINISNVYLANKGYIRFGNYGPSTLKTNVNINNSSFGANIQHINETPDSINDNFEIIEFNNEIRNI